jgi:hypothetical protein
MMVKEKRGFVSQETIDLIKSSVPLGKAYKRYVGGEMRRYNGYYKVQCINHLDTDPSLALYDDGHFHCYGCKWSGDVITFTEKALNVSFPEAVYRLIEDFSLSVPKEELEKIKVLVEGLQKSKTQGGQYNTPTTSSKASLGAREPQKRGVFKGGLSSQILLRGASLEELRDYLGLSDENWLDWLVGTALIEEGLAMVKDGKLTWEWDDGKSLNERVRRGEGIRAISFPYWIYENGEWELLRRELRLQFPRYEGDDKGFRWLTEDRGKEFIPFGLPYLTYPELKANPYLFIVEGPTDVLSLLRMGVPALGLPSITVWNPEWIERFIKPLAGNKIIVLTTELMGNKNDKKIEEQVKKIRLAFELTGYLVHRVSFFPYKDPRNFRLGFIKKEKGEPTDIDLWNFLFFEEEQEPIEQLQNYNHRWHR